MVDPVSSTVKQSKARQSKAKQSKSESKVASASDGGSGVH